MKPEQFRAGQIIKFKGAAWQDWRGEVQGVNEQGVKSDGNYSLVAYVKTIKGRHLSGTWFHVNRMQCGLYEVVEEPIPDEEVKPQQMKRATDYMEELGL